MDYNFLFLNTFNLKLWFLILKIKLLPYKYLSVDKIIVTIQHS
jgi:hypothetical protein